MTRLAIASAVVEPGRGGIAAVCRLMIAAAREAGIPVRAFSYLDDAPQQVAGVPVSTARNDKFRYAGMAHLDALWASHLLFDSVGVAKARPRLPLLARPYAIFMHGVEAWEKARPEALAAFRGAARIFVNSHYTLERFQSLHGPLPQASVCLLATEEDEPAPARLASSGPPTALILGRMDAAERYKGHDQLIDAWPTVRAAVPNARLVMAGGGSDLDRIRARAADSPAAAGIEILGFVPQSDLGRLWAEAHVLAMPSRGEGFGLVYIEAMRLGLPVISSRHDAGGEVNCDGETGFAVDLDREGVLAESMIALLSQPALARRMGDAGRALWRERYRGAAFKARFTPLLLDFLGAGVKPAQAA